jgi:hypothetical protein
MNLPEFDYERIIGHLVTKALSQIPLAFAYAARAQLLAVRGK